MVTDDQARVEALQLRDETRASIASLQRLTARLEAFVDNLNAAIDRKTEGSTVENDDEPA